LEVGGRDALAGVLGGFDGCKLPCTGVIQATFQKAKFTVTGLLGKAFDDCLK